MSVKTDLKSFQLLLLASDLPPLTLRMTIDNQYYNIILYCNHIFYIALLHYCSNIQSSIKVLSTYLTVILV